MILFDITLRLLPLAAALLLGGYWLAASRRRRAGQQTQAHLQQDAILNGEAARKFLDDFLLRAQR